MLAASAEIEEALRQVRQNRPDLVLLNLQRVGDDSLKVAGALHGESPESRVIVMGMEPFHEDVAGFVRAGVSGFIMADASSDAFLATGAEPWKIPSLEGLPDIAALATA